MSFTKTTSSLIFIFFMLMNTSQAQYIMEAEEGYTPQIGTIVFMLNDLKERITQNVDNLDQESTDFLLDENANSIGAMILRLAATEKHYQVYTFENRQYNTAEAEIWDIPMSLGAPARKALQGKSISHYLDIWTEVRQETLRLLKTKDDAWFASKVPESSINNHFAWYHVMEHQANHMGQIRMIAKRISN